MLTATTISAFFVTLSWDPVLCVQRRSEIASYTVLYGVQSSSVRMNITGITDTTLTIRELTEETSYVFQVAAVSREGVSSAFSEPIMITTQPPGES